MKFSIKNFFSKCDQILQAVGDTHLPRLQTFSVKTKHVQHQHTRQKKRLRHQHPCRLFTTNTRQISLVFIAELEKLGFRKNTSTKIPTLGEI